MTHSLSQKQHCDRLIRFLYVLAVTLVLFSPQLAMAGVLDGGPQWILDQLNGGLMRTVAIIAVIALGVSAFFGRIAWNWAIGIVVGIVLVFGAAGIVDAIKSAASTSGS